MEEKVILINGAIDEANSINIINQLQELVTQCEAIYMHNDNCRYTHMIKPMPSLKLVISSPGGYVVYGMTIMSYIEDLKDMGVLVTTVCNFAYSMGFMIFMAGDLRYFANEKFSRVLHHQCSGVAQGRLTDMENDYKIAKEDERIMNEYIAERSKLTLEIQEAHKHEDWVIRYDEAVELGLVNEDIKNTDYYKRLQEQGIVPKEVEDKKEKVKEEIGEVGEEASNDVKEVTTKEEDMSYIIEMIDNCDQNCGKCDYWEECGGELLWLIKEDKLDELIEVLQDEDKLDELIEVLEKDEDECNCDGSCEECTCGKCNKDEEKVNICLYIGRKNVNIA